MYVLFVLFIIALGIWQLPLAVLFTSLFAAFRLACKHDVI